MRPGGASKVMSLGDAAALVGDGDTVALQSMGLQSCPAAMVRELIRQGRRDLTVASVVGGIAVDWLAAAGSLRRFVGPLVSMEHFGLCQSFRRECERGRVEFEEYSESGLLARLAAGARGLPFTITKGMLGTDLVPSHDESTRVIEDPWTGEPVVACRAFVPDVAIVHAHRADRLGNAQYERGTIWPDVQIFPKAARMTIVTVESLVEEAEVRRRPWETAIPHFAVDAVVEAPHGCHPTSFFPAYGYDDEFHERYARASRDPEATAGFLNEHVLVPEHSYVARAGGGEMLDRISRWRDREGS